MKNFQPVPEGFKSIFDQIKEVRCPNCYTEFERGSVIEKPENLAVCPSCLWTSDFADKWEFK